MRGSSPPSSARNKLSSISVYLLIAILINIVFIQCNFWFKLFEWRRYVIALIDWIVMRMQSMMQLEQPEQEQQQQPQQLQPPQSLDQQHSMASLPTSIIHLGRVFTMPFFWFHIRHLFQWPLFISINLVQLFIQFIYLNCAYIAFGMAASGMATVKATASVVAIQQPIQSIKIATAIAKCLPHTELFIIKNDVDYVQFNGIIANGMHPDDALFRCVAANNQQMIIQDKQTDQQL